MNELEQVVSNQAAQAEMTGLISSLINRCLQLASELAVVRQKLSESEKNNNKCSEPSSAASAAS